VADDVHNASLKTLLIEDMNLKRAFYLTRHKHRSPSPLSRAFVDFLKNHYRNMP